MSSPVLYPGIGEAVRADVTVIWPSGVIQSVMALGSGQHHVVTEPEVLSVAPAGRHISLSSGEVASLTVQPQVAATAVTAHIIHGDGIPGEAVQGDGGTWTIEISPPPIPGFAHLEVRIDGQPIGIRPRIWWD